MYRDTNSNITKLWRAAQTVLGGMLQNNNYTLGRKKVLTVMSEVNGIRLPSNLIMRYEDLKSETTETGTEYSYKTRRGRVTIYGGKVIENVCQGIARCVMSDQMLRI